MSTPCTIAFVLLSHGELGALIGVPKGRRYPVGVRGGWTREAQSAVTESEREQAPSPTL